VDGDGLIFDLAIVCNTPHGEASAILRRPARLRIKAVLGVVLTIWLSPLS